MAGKVGTTVRWEESILLPECVAGGPTLGMVTLPSVYDGPTTYMKTIRDP